MAKAEFLIEAGRQDIVMTRMFDAPRELVFKVFIDPDLIPQWWGPRALTTVVDRMEPKPGGVWRYVQHDRDGNVYAFHGIYHEITSPARVVSTFEFEGMPGHVALETTTLEERAGKTTLTTRSVFQSVEDRDGMVQSGMEQGAAEAMDRLAELLVAPERARRK